MTYIEDERSTSRPIERAILVGADVRGVRPLLSLDESLQELAMLADTAGIKVVGQVTQHLSHIDPQTYIGSGKVEELRETATASLADMVIFDDELSPRHQRELEEHFGEHIKVIDRSALILDIFAQHANTREGALQVELAQYEYRLPRLTRAWTHLARQSGGGGGRSGNGGVGLRGPGETQLEADRREISRKISKLKADIEEVRAHRSRHRQQRIKSGMAVIALVGYTNAGKSTLLNALTGANVYAANQLFATLDPTTRRLTLPGGKVALFSDTVGFIQKLPTTLIAAFRATLEEILEADLLIHVVDAAHPNAHAQIETVEDTLAKIEMPPTPRILVLNKVDLLDSVPNFKDMDAITENYDAVIKMSAKKRQGVVDVIAEVERLLVENMLLIKIALPYKRGDLISLIHEVGIIEEEIHTAEGVEIRAHIPPRMLIRFPNAEEQI